LLNIINITNPTLQFAISSYSSWDLPCKSNIPNSM
jgi:hypothetical protein